MANEARTNMPNLWKSQPVGSVEISLEQLRRKAQKLQKRVLWRNVREYVAAVFVVAVFTYYIWRFPSPLVRLGCILVIMGTSFVVYTLHQRGSARTLPPETASHSCVEFHRRELQRQRDLLLSVWTWYLLPFVPGIVVFNLGLYLQKMQQAIASAHAGRIATMFAATALGYVLGFIGIGKLNARAAAKLQREIDALDAIEKES